MSDLIDRQMAIDALTRKSTQLHGLHWGDHPEAPHIESGVLSSIEIIRELPSAQPERKKGKWITVNGRLGNEVECENCHSVFWYWMENYRFCPNCGADMRGESE